MSVEYKDQVVYLLREILKALNRLKPKRRVTRKQLDLWEAGKAKKPYGPSDVDPAALDDHRTPEERAKCRDMLRQTAQAVARKSATMIGRKEAL